MKQVGVTLATAGGATRNLREGKVRREAPLFPLQDFPWDFLLLARQSLEDLASGWVQGRWDWISGVMNIHQPELASASIYLAGRGWVSGSP